MEKNKEELVRLIQTQEGNILKTDDVSQGTHENKDNVHIKKGYINNHIPRGFDSNNEGMRDGSKEVSNFPRFI